MSLDHLTHPFDRPAKRGPGRPAKLRRPKVGRVGPRMLHNARRGLMLLCLLESAPPEVLAAWRSILRALERRARRRAARLAEQRARA